MLVRDKTKRKTEYKGRMTWAVDALCPCRPCFNAHDCGYNTFLGWHIDMHCATNWNSGCPVPRPELEHVFTPHGRVCRRCGARRSSVQR